MCVVCPLLCCSACAPVALLLYSAPLFALTHTPSPSRPTQLFSMMLAPFQSLNFTGMGGPMGVYEPYDTDACDSSGMHCTEMDNEAYYTHPGFRLPSVSAASPGAVRFEPGLFPRAPIAS